MNHGRVRLFLDETPAVLAFSSRSRADTMRIVAPDPCGDQHRQILALLDEAQRRRPFGGRPLSICVVVPESWAQVRRIEGLPEGAGNGTLDRIVATSPSRFFLGRPSMVTVGPVARDASGAHWCTGFASDQLDFLRSECRRRSLTVHCVQSARNVRPAPVGDELREKLALHTRDPLCVSAPAARAVTALAIAALFALLTIPPIVLQRLERRATAAYELLRAEHAAEFHELHRASVAATLAFVTGEASNTSPSSIRALASLSDALIAENAIQAMHIDSASVTLTVVGHQLEGLVSRIDRLLPNASPELIGPIASYAGADRPTMRATVRLRHGAWSAPQRFPEGAP